MRRTPAALLIPLALTALENPIYTESGAVRGHGADVQAYRGIPYASPPTGGLRWRPPVPAARWIDVLDAKTPGPMCAQIRRNANQADSTNENCLTLNVWTPARLSIDRLPVMVWIHGGGFVFGDSNIGLMDGTELARQGVVVVSFNYRLGVFGFLSHPDLTAESGTAGSGNYGLMDQIAALKWVQRNITHFGGDPGNVTIFGESAGGSSVAYLMVSPLARGLFQRAISQSPGRIFAKIRASRHPKYGLEPSENLGLEVGRSIRALRNTSVAEVLKLADTSLDFVMRRKGREFWAVVDGTVLPYDPAQMFLAGRFHAVPLMIGVTSDEGFSFTRSLGPFRPEDVESFLADHYPKSASRLRSLFPAATPDQAHRALTDAFADAEFYHGVRSVARAVAARNVPVYLYRFSRVKPEDPVAGVGALHASEIPYVFGTLRAPAAKDAEVSRAMMAAWVRFAKTGRPTGPSLPPWPRYDANSDQLFEFGDELKAGKEIRHNALNTWAEVFRQLR